MFILFLLLGAFGGFASGLLGIGGAVLMIPLMLNVPPLLGFPELTMQSISGLSIIQVFFSSISGMIRYSKNRLVHRRALIFIGSSMAAGTLAGVVFSKIFPDRVLLIAFGILAAAATAMMLLKPPAQAGGEGTESPINTPIAILCGTSIGILSGMVGAGGGFILIPLMIYVLRIQTRTAIGTSLGIVFIGSISGVVGKTIAGQVDWILAAALVLGAIPLAQIGAAVSKRLPAKALHILLIAVILLTSLQTWWRILGL